MATLGEYILHDDWKNEKHVPVIDCPDTVKAGEAFRVEVVVGKQIAHPNTTEHHIQWITLYFQPSSTKFTYELGHFDFRSHGASVAGPNKGPAYTDPVAVTQIKLNEPGVLIAVEHCNIHGLWESSKEITVQQQAAMA